MQTSDLPTIPCPGCRATMKTEALERHDHGSVNVELCFACQGIWFDHLASVELAPAAVISLFKEIHAHREVVRQPLSGRLNCPRCEEALVQSFDVAKSGRFTYFRCPRGDGRFTPFFQFLREKQFVRSLTPGEVQHLRAQVRQVNCSQCGAPVDLELGTECKYCHAPLSLLDPDAVEKAVRMWSEAQDRQRRTPDPGAAATAILEAQRAAAQRSDLPTRPAGGTVPWDAMVRSNNTELAVDLVAAGIAMLGHLFESNH